MPLYNSFCTPACCLLQPEKLLKLSAYFSCSVWYWSLGFGEAVPHVIHNSYLFTWIVQRVWKWPAQSHLDQIKHPWKETLKQWNRQKDQQPMKTFFFKQTECENMFLSTCLFSICYSFSSTFPVIKELPLSICCVKNEVVISSCDTFLLWGCCALN